MKKYLCPLMIAVFFATAYGQNAANRVAGVPAGNVRGDFDGDGRTDLAVFRPGNGQWYLYRSTLGPVGAQWGIVSDRLVPGDYDGDSRTDLGVFRATADPSQADFYILQMANFSHFSSAWGIPNDVPVIGDYDGDVKDDLAIYRPSTRTWYVLRSSNATVQIFTNFPTATPIVMDHDGDGKNDFAIYMFGEWFVAQSSLNYQYTIFGLGGLAGDKIAPCDYDGDGKDNPAIFRSSNGTWQIRRPDQGTTVIAWGISTDVPVPGDYDGDGKCDVAIYRDGVWWINGSVAGTVVAHWGTTGDIPIPNRYLP